MNNENKKYYLGMVIFIVLNLIFGNFFVGPLGLSIPFFSEFVELYNSPSGYDKIYFIAVYLFLTFINWFVFILFYSLTEKFTKNKLIKKFIYILKNNWKVKLNVLKLIALPPLFFIIFIIFFPYSESIIPNLKDINTLYMIKLTLFFTFYNYAFGNYFVLFLWWNLVKIIKRLIRYFSCHISDSVKKISGAVFFIIINFVFWVFINSIFLMALFPMSRAIGESGMTAEAEKAFDFIWHYIIFQYIAFVIYYYLIEKLSKNDLIQNFIYNLRNNLKYKLKFLLILDSPFIALGLLMFFTAFTVPEIAAEGIVSYLTIPFNDIALIITLSLLFYIAGDFVVLFLWWELVKFTKNRRGRSIKTN